MIRIAVTLLVCLFATTTVCGAEIPWKTGTYQRQPVGDDPVPLVQLFKEFGKVQEVPVIVAEDVQGAVSARYPALPPEKYLDALTADNDLIWYFDGSAIHVYTDDVLQSAALPLESITPEQLTATLQRLGVYTERFPIRSEPELGLIFVAGPPRYLEVIDQILKSADLRARQQARVDIAVEVIPLRYAWADDQSFLIGDTQLGIPGVATLLRSVLGDEQSGPLSARLQQLPNNLPSLNGFGLIRPQNLALANAQQAAIDAQIAAAGAEAQARAAQSVKEQTEEQLAAQIQPVIQPDRRTNSIIIKDVRQRIDVYRQVIRQLDQPTQLVQIKASLIDITAESGFQLGPPYQAMWRHNGNQHSATARIDTEDIANLAMNPGNFTISLTSNQVTQFLANLQALETKGDARLVSKPAVVTIDNVDAFLEETEEFYVRVAGFEQVDLFNVTVGTKLRILPHVIEEYGGRRVKLNVRVEDGSRSETSEVDEVPVISRNTITTQAVLLEGQSLLIGGLMREQETKTIRGLPVLSRIPKIGFMFRDTIHDSRRMERLVLLTPTIIDLPHFHPPAHPEDQFLEPAEPLPQPVSAPRLQTLETNRNWPPAPEFRNLASPPPQRRRQAEAPNLPGRQPWVAPPIESHAASPAHSENVAQASFVNQDPRANDIAPGALNKRPLSSELTRPQMSPPPQINEQHIRRLPPVAPQSRDQQPRVLIPLDRQLPFRAAAALPSTRR